MKISASFTLATAILALSNNGNALRLPNFNDILGQANFQLSSAQELLFQKFGSGKGDLLEALSSYLNEPIENVPAGTKQLWTEMISKFPESVSKLNFKLPPKKLKSKLAPSNFVKVKSSKAPEHSLRIKSTPIDLGVDTVKQYSGYLDVENEDKHFFFWMFESRNDPKNDPIILWLNGGPGCSSLTGLFFELGSSSIDAGMKPIYNPHSWNSNATVIYLDQPVNVGYSYSSSSVSNTLAAGKDVYAFLELFYAKFPEYLGLDFHIAGESYAGHYIPVFASEILSHADRSFNLTSVLIGNGLTDPLTQYKYYEPMACGAGGEPSVLEPEECSAMNDSLPRCLSLIENCYKTNSVWTCTPATIYCNNAELGPYQKTGKNVYDMRKDCEGSLCYSDMTYIDQYLNRDDVMEKLGVEVESYESCNFDVNRNFVLAGDWMKPYHTAVVDLLESGLPILVYAGDKDFICNWLGNQAWTNELKWSGKENFAKESLRSWSVGKHVAGEVKNYENFTFLRVYGGGHMVPYDQPKNSLDMVNRWISGDRTFK